MKVFLTGSTGAIGKHLVPMLIEAGHEVVAQVRSADRGREVEAAGATAAIVDPLDRNALTDAIRRAEPEVLINQLTSLSRLRGFRNMDRDFALTNRFRTEVNDAMIEAGRAVGAKRFIAQSFCGWPSAPTGNRLTTEEDPIVPDLPSKARQTLEAIRHLEKSIRETTDLHAMALRYGIFYGPGTGFSRDSETIDFIRKGMMPIVGDGGGVWSFIHIEDAARATVAAVTRGAPGLYNIVDDEPAPVAEWLPALAAAVGGKPPRRFPVFLGKLVLGEMGVHMMTSIHGGSNAKAKRELGWQPEFASWRRGFAEGL